jgi:hypothetical protein
MRLSNDGSGWSAWMTYAASAPWVFGSGDGLKTVYVQFKDSLENILPSSPASPWTPRRLSAPS